ncbi:hypothetical protein WCE55_04695 [Luteimonas sp. MJ293]|uniref:hypothetical protein n=1 Tax=Luteimonas sp. MJ146 TaxID=3129240 RepID=UPI0031BA949E
MKTELFVIEELEARFEMEVVNIGGTAWDTSLSQGSEAANEACCHNYTCIGGDVRPL